MLQSKEWQTGLNKEAYNMLPMRDPLRAEDMQRLK